MDNIDEFNLITGRVFALLYDRYPVPIEIDPSALAMDIGVVPPEMMQGEPDPAQGLLSSGRRFDQVLDGTLRWLDDEGFIRRAPVSVTSGVVLTKRAFATMNATPKVLDPNQNKNAGTIGDRPSSAASEIGTEAGRSAIGRLVGMVIERVAGA